MSTLLRDQRLRLDISTTDVARRLAVHPMSVLHWERRERLPGPIHLTGLAATLALDLSTVVDFFDQVRPPPPPASAGVRGHGLRALRRSAGIPVTAISQALGVGPSTIYNWEAGRVRIPTDHLPALARLLRVEPASLRASLDRAPALSEAGPVSALRRFRRRTGLSQQQVAERIGSTRHRVGSWERGVRPPVWAVRRLARVYGLPVARLAQATGVSAPLLLDVTSWRAGDLPAALAVLRAWSGLTQSEIAAKGGWHPTTVRSWESGRAQPSTRARRTLEQMYGLEAGSLLAAYPGVSDARVRSSPAPAGSAR